MSWDIFVQDIPEDVRTINDMHQKYHNYRPKIIGDRSELIAKIKKIVPDVDFCDPSWGVLRKPDYCIEFNMGNKQECPGFALHVSGGESVNIVIADILKCLGLKAFDPNSDTGLFKMSNSTQISKETEEHNS
ncbi:MAG: hypothetical protein ABFD91_17305 [Anaerohalosphaeraceae bacterium]